MFVPSIVAYIWGNMFKIVFEGKNPYFDSKVLFLLLIILDLHIKKDEV